LKGIKKIDAKIGLNAYESRQQQEKPQRKGMEDRTGFHQSNKFVKRMLGDDKKSKRLKCPRAQVEDNRRMTHSDAHRHELLEQIKLI
jgi:hypothetical protein